MKSNTTLIISTLIIAGTVYWYFFTGTENQLPLTENVAEDPAQTQFWLLVSELPLSFDTKIFSDTRFNALIDITTQISPESLGRLDPFATIQGVSVK